MHWLSQDSFRKTKRGPFKGPPTTLIYKIDIMGLQEVKDEILNEAEKKSQELEKQGENKAEEIIEDAEKEAEKIVKVSREELENEKEKIRKKRTSKANMDAKQKIQKSKEKNVKKAFESFEEELNKLSESEREKFVENAKENANFNVGLVKGSEEFEEFVDQDFEEMESKGLILESSNGEKSLNLTFSRIRDEYEKNYRSNVAKKLFSEV